MYPLNPNPKVTGLLPNRYVTTPISKKLDNRRCKRRSAALSFFLIFFSAAVFSQPNLETSVPSNFVVRKGTLSISSSHYRVGAQSLRWDWKAGDTLIVNLTAAQEAQVNPYLFTFDKNHFELWINNELALNQEFGFVFVNYNKREQFRFSFNANYTGWRRILRSYRFDMKKIEQKNWTGEWNVDKMYIVAPKSGSGFIFLDNLIFLRNAELKYSDRQMPDLYRLADGKAYSSGFVYSCDSLDRSIPAPTPTATETKDLAVIRQRIVESIVSTAPTASELSSANSQYATYNIVVTGNLIKGKPIIQPKDILPAVSTFTRSYKYNNNTDSRDKAINLLKLMLESGIAGGSGLYIGGSVDGYADKTFFPILIQAYSFLPTSVRYQIWDWLKWSANANLGWMENANGLYNTDNLYTLPNAYLGTILYSPTDASTVKDLKCFKNYLEKFLTPQKGNTDGSKVDGTAFHHYAHYNAYMYAYATLSAEILPVFSKTYYQISRDAYYNLRKVVYAQYITSNGEDFANSTCGRHPFNVQIDFFKKNFTRLALLGGEVLGTTYDPAIAGAGVRLYGTMPELPSVTAESTPEGFWQMNYSPLGIYRRSNWAATIRGINQYFWGTEIYQTANRYGRYQSYGALEVIYPEGAAASGFKATGWDWNKIPGTTSILLPFTSLKLSIASNYERNEYNFSGGVRFNRPAKKAPSDVVLQDLQGEYGMFGLNFKQPAYTPTHNATFVFRKSFFCFGDKILCLGSNINNNDATNKTITTLFQNALPASSTTTIVNGVTRTGVATNEDLNKTNSHWLLDAFKTGYYVMAGSTIHIERRSQTSPDQSGSSTTTAGNYANAYIDHGAKPISQKYAYIVMPGATTEKMTALSTSMQSTSTRPFEIVQQDTVAHIVKEKATGVLGFSLFLPTTNLTNNVFLKGNDKPCMTMMRQRNDTLRISLVNPDLNLVNNTSVAVPITLTLYGQWIRVPDAENKDAAVLSSDINQTKVQFSSADGNPGAIALLRVNSVLPVSAVSLSGTYDHLEEQNVLNLKIATDEHTVSYLEKSPADGNTWNVIADQPVAAKDGEQPFTFVDKDIQADVNSYRVKWQEQTGEWQYSNIVVIKSVTKNETGIGIAPNPARNYFTIQLKQNPSRAINWILSDASGKRVKFGNLSSIQENINVTGIAPGQYFLKLSSGETYPVIVIR